MVKLEFYATGFVSPSGKIPSVFPPQMACPDRSSLLEKRNLQEQYFKAASKQKHDASVYKENYIANNQNYSDKSHCDKIKLRSHSDHQTKEEFYSSPRHFATLKLQNEKVFAASPRNDATLSRDTFQNRVRSMSRIKTGQEGIMATLNNTKCSATTTATSTATSTALATKRSTSQKQFIERDHFYVTKPMLRINKDFMEKPLIKNVQVVSDDLPNWCQTTNKYYTPENIDKSMKQKIVVKLDQDIFGNQLQKYPNNFMFACEPPTQGIRFEKTRMVIADKVDVLAKKTIRAKKQLMFGKCQLRWDEDISKQKFEPRLPFKIGHEGQPYIKKLEVQRNKSQHEFQKIGQVDSFKLEPKDKLIQLKIGHGFPEIINPIKFSLS